MDRRVVITGIGVVSPIGIGKDAFWNSLERGVSGVRLIEGFDTSPYRTKIAAQIKGFDPSKYLSLQKVYVMDRFSQLAMVATKEAFEDSKFALNDSNKNRIGVIWGSSEGGINTREEQYRKFFSKGPRAIDPMTLPKAMGVAPATNIAIEYGITGLNYSITNTCSSGAVSVGEGYRLIKHGYADVIVAGASEAPITPAMLCGWCKLRALSTRNDIPEQAVRPFSKDRDGPVLGEGAGVVILESLEHAMERDSNIYCEVVGYWSNSDAYHLTFPNARGQAEAMKGALESGNISNEEVDYINAHGTATPINDKGETEAIKNVFGSMAYSIPVSSTKSMIGHLLGAAGTVESIASILAIENQFLPPTINYEAPDPECDLDYVPNKGRRSAVNTVMTNSFGFGGANASIILTRYRRQ